MKAKAMKKTLSCILALTLTASMMSESLSAFADFTPTPGIAQADTDPDPVITEANIITATQLAQLTEVSATPTAGQCEKADTILGLSNAHYQIQSADIVDAGTGSTVSALSLYIPDDAAATAITPDNLYSALRSVGDLAADKYYVKLHVTQVDKTSGSDLVGANSTDLYIALTNLAYDPAIAGTQTATGTLNTIGLYKGDAAIAWAGFSDGDNLRKDVTNGTAGGTLTVSFPKLTFTSADGEITGSVAATTVATASKTVSVQKTGVTNIDVFYPTDASTPALIANKRIEKAFAGYKYRFVWNDPALNTDDRQSYDLVSDAHISCQLGGAGNYDKTELGASGTSQINFKYTASGSEDAGTCLVKTETRADAVTLESYLPITIAPDALVSDQFALATTAELDKVKPKGTGQTDADLLPILATGETGTTFHTGQNVILVKHLNESDQYIIGVPTISNSKVTDVSWYAINNTAADKVLVNNYLTAYKNYAESGYTSGTKDEFDAAVTAITNAAYTPLEKAENAQACTFDSDNIFIDYTPKAGSDTPASVTITFKDGTYTSAVKENNLFDLKQEDADKIKVYPVYPAENLFTVLKDAGLTSVRVDIFNPETETTSTVSVIKNIGDATQAIASGYTVVIDRVETTKGENPTVTVTPVAMYTQAGNKVATEYSPVNKSVDETKIKNTAVLPAVYIKNPDDESTYTYQFRILAGECESLAAVKTAEDGSTVASTVPVDFLLAQDTVANISAINVIAEETAPEFPSFFYGDPFYLGETVLMAQHESGILEWVFTVPTFEQEAETVNVDVTGVQWRYFAIDNNIPANVEAQNKIKTFITAYNTFADAVDSAANAAAVTTALDTYNLAVTALGDTGTAILLVKDDNETKTAAVYNRPDILYRNLNAETKDGFVDIKWRGAEQRFTGITIGAASIEGIKAIGGIDQRDATNASRIVYATTDTERIDQNATASPEAWRETIPNGLTENERNRYTVPGSNVKDEFSSTLDYEIGDIVYRGGTCYVCTTGHAAGVWSEEHFVETAYDAPAVFFFNVGTTDEEVIDAIRTGDAVIGVTINGQPAYKDLKEGLTDGTFGLLDRQPVEKVGAQWLGFYYNDTTNTGDKAKVPFYLPVFVGQGYKLPVIKTITAEQKQYYIGEELNKKGIKVDLKDQYSYVIAKADEDYELGDLKSSYWSVYFNNGSAETPKIDKVKSPNVYSAIEEASDRIRSIVVYNEGYDLVGFNIPDANFKFTDNYVASISVSNPTNTTYQVGYYPDGIGVDTAKVPDVDKVFKGSVLTLSFANKEAQKDVEIPLVDFVNTEADALTSRKGTKKYAGLASSEKNLGAGTITITAVSGLTTDDGEANVGTVRYKVEYKSDDNSLDVEVKPVYVDITTEQVAIADVDLYDGRAISADDYYTIYNPVLTAEGAEICVPTTEFYVGEDVDKNTVTYGFKSDRTEGNKAGSFVVTFTNGKKQLVTYNGYTLVASYIDDADYDYKKIDGTVDFPTIDSSTEENSREVKFTYTVNEKKGQYAKFTTKTPLKLTVSVTQDEVEELEANGMLVFYQGDTEFRFNEYVKNGKIEKFDSNSHYYVDAEYKHRGIKEEAFDLLKDSDWRKFTYADSEFSTLTATTGGKTVTFNYTVNGKTTELKVPITVLEVPYTLSVIKPEGMKTVYGKNEVIAIGEGKIKIERGGQNPWTETFNISDILANSDNLGEFKGRFKVVDQSQNVLSGDTIELGEGTNTLTFIFYTTIPNDPKKVATATLDISILQDYITDFKWNPEGEDVPATAKVGFIGGTPNFTVANGGAGVSYKKVGDAAEYAALDLSTLPCYSTDDQGNPIVRSDNVLNGVKVSGLKDELKRSYFTVTVADPDNAGKVISDFVFNYTGTHTVTVYMDDQKHSYQIDVEEVIPTTITLGAGTSVTYTDKTGKSQTAVLAAPEYGITVGTTKNQMFEGMELAFTAGDALVKFKDGHSEVIKLATDKNLFIKDGTFNKDTAGQYKVVLQYVYGTGETDFVETAEEALPITVQEDTVADFTIVQRGTRTGKSIADNDRFIFFVGDDADNFMTYQDITVDLKYKSGIESKGIILEKDCALMKDFTFTINTSTPTTGDIPNRDLVVKHKDGKTNTYFYMVDTDELTEATQVEGANLKQTIYKAEDAALVLDGYKFNATFKDGTTEKDIELANLGTGWTVSILKADDNSVVVADIKNPKPEEKANLKAVVDPDHADRYKAAYKIGVNYSEKSGSVDVVKAHAAPIALPNTELTYVEAADYAAKIAISAPATDAEKIKKFGNSKEKIVVPQYMFSSAEDFEKAILTSGITFKVTGSDTASSIIEEALAANSDDLSYDASDIDFTVAGTNYLLGVTYQNYTEYIPVTVEARTIKALELVKANEIVEDDKYGKVANLALGVGQVWDGKETKNAANDNNPFYVRPLYSDGTTYGTPINLAEEIKNAATSKVTVTYSTATAGSQTINVTFGGKSVSIDVEVVKPTDVVSFKFTKLPTQTSYNANEEPKLAGAEIEAVFTAVNEAIYENHYTANVTDLTLLKELFFTADGEGNTTIAVGKYGADNWVPTIEPIDLDGKGTFTITENTPKSITVQAPIKEYYLKYTGKYAASSELSTLLGEITDETVPNDNKLPKKKLSDSVIESQVFDDETGAVLVKYLDNGGNDSTVNFKDNVTGTTGKGAVRISVDGANGPKVVLPTTAGTYTANVFYYENPDETDEKKIKSDSYTIKVIKDSVDYVELVSAPQNLEYIQGDAVNLTGAKAKLHFVSGRESDPIELTGAQGKKMFKLSSYSMAQTGDIEVTVEYYEKDANGKEVIVGASDKGLDKFTINVKENIAESIRVSRKPKNKYSYNTSDDDFNFTGGELEVKWKAPLSDGSYTQTFDMQEQYESGALTVDKVDFRTAVDSKTIKIHFLGQDYPIEISIDADEILSVEPVSVKDKFDLNAAETELTGTIKITYELGDPKTVDLSDPNYKDRIKITGWNSAKPQTVQVTVTYTEGKYSGSFTIPVTFGNNAVASITSDKGESFKIYKGTAFDKTAYPITINYTDTTLEAAHDDLTNKTGKLKIAITKDGTAVDDIDTSAVGEYTITVTSAEDTTTTAGVNIKVTVAEIKVESITAANPAIREKTKTDWVLENEAITINYDNGTKTETKLGDSAKVSYVIKNAKGETVTAIDKTVEGTYTVSVTSIEDSAYTAADVITVTISDVVVDTFTLDKTTATVKKGTALDLSGINANVTYTGADAKRYNLGTDADKVIIDTSKVKFDTVGDYEVTVILKEDPTKTATITVSVYDITIVSFTPCVTEPVKYKVGDIVDYSKFFVTVKYSEGDDAVIYLASQDPRIKIDGLDKIDLTKAGTYTVTVTSTEDTTKSCAFTLIVEEGNKISDEDVEDVPEETPSINSRVVVFEKSGEEWTEAKGFENLTAALDSKSGYGKGEGEYMFVITGDISEGSALKFPAKAKSITIVGDGKINLGKATTINLKQADISIDAEITGADLNVTIGEGKTLKIGERTKKLGKITGNKKGSTLDILGSTTIGSILTFSKVYASDGSVVTIPAKGKVQNIADLKAEIILDGTATVSATTVNEGIFHLTKNGTAKQPIAKVTLAGETKTFLDIIVDNEDAALEGGMKVLYGSGKFNAAKNVNIINKDAQGNDLGAVAYNSNKEVRAENTEAITYQIGEGDEQSTSSFEALFDLLKNETGDVTVTVNSDSVISKNNIPKKLASLTIKGATDEVTITSNLTSIKTAYKLAFEDINIVAKNAKGADSALTISTTGSELRFVNTSIVGKSVSITGNKKNTTLKICDLNRVDKIQNFAVAEITGMASAAKNFTVETLKLEDDAFISFDNGCVVKITKLSGAGTIGIAKPENPKKFKAITLTSSDITEEGVIALVQVEFKATNSGALFGVIVEGSFQTGTQIFTDKSKSSIAYDKIFDASGLKDEGKLTNTKGKVTLS